VKAGTLVVTALGGMGHERAAAVEHDEPAFAGQFLNGSVVLDLLPPLSLADLRGYLEHVADRRLAQLGLEPLYGVKNPLAFMDLQDVQELSNFSSAASRPTRSASPGRSPSTTSSKAALTRRPALRMIITCRVYTLSI
jgi:hypothetical protein